MVILVKNKCVKVTLGSSRRFWKVQEDSKRSTKVEEGSSISRMFKNIIKGSQGSRRF